MKGFFVCILVCVSAIACEEAEGKGDKQLLFVQILWRHGDRSPTSLYPNDPNPVSVWPEGLGKLTQLGRKQHYALGKFFRSMYSNFVTSDPNEVHVNSTDYDRCLRSAQVNLASFYAPTPRFQFEEGVHFQPIPVYYLPRAINKYLSTESDCPRSAVEYRRLVQSARGRQFNQKHQQMYEYYTFYSGKPVTNWTSAWELYDTIYVEKIHNLTIPTWVEPYWDELRLTSNEGLFEMYNSPLLHRLRAGPFIGLTVENMLNKVSGKTPHLKVQIYSAHDDTIAVLMSALGIFNKVLPPYCASLIVELYEMPNQAKTIRFLYQNSPDVAVDIAPPHVLVLPGCSEYCPLDYFVIKTKHLVPFDWDLECGNKK